MERQPVMATMRALRAHTRGGPEVLVYESVPRPTAGDGELLIAVHAAAITFDELTWPETWSSDGVDRTPSALPPEVPGAGRPASCAAWGPRGATVSPSSRRETRSTGWFPSTGTGLPRSTCLCRPV